jgi:nucleotide-binding universal stress UspA family protein
MSYKTIVVHVDDTPHAAIRFDLAARIAHAASAHLIGLASTGLNRFFRETVAMDLASPAITPYLDTLRQRAHLALDEFTKVAAGAGLPDAERRQTDDDADQMLAALASYCDLCVLGHYGAQPRPDGQKRQLAADVASGSGCPVLLVPDRLRPLLPARRILLAWNGRREAARAMHFAMPMLQSAAAVDVAILDEALDTERDIRPGVDIALALKRHGVAAEVIQKRDAGGDAGHALMALAAEHGADLIVMGCYGHARVRELLLGGATRTVLMGTQLPVFMAA